MFHLRSNKPSSIDPAKKYTFDGKPCRIIAADLKSQFSIAIVVSDEGVDSDTVMQVREKDLVEAKTEIERWLNIYPKVGTIPDEICPYETREHADKHAGLARIACIRIRYSTGDGLESSKPVESDPEPEWKFPDGILAPWIVVNSIGQVLASEYEPFQYGNGWSSESGMFVIPNFVMDYPPCTDWRRSKRKNPKTA